VCFHTDDKLRTVLWGWAGCPFDETEHAGLVRVHDATAAGGGLAEALGEHLTAAEIAAIRRRCARLLAAGRFPEPEGGWPSIPWPPF
jgi:uncharacterized repeat protein (TIGR03843 family)